MRKHNVKIQTEIGIVKQSADDSKLFSGTCHRCGGKIFFLKMWGSKNFMVQKTNKDGEYISHFLRCPMHKKNNDTRFDKNRKFSFLQKS